MKPKIDQFTNLKCCKKAREPLKNDVFLSKINNDDICHAVVPIVDVLLNTLISLITMVVGINVDGGIFWT